MSLQTHTVLSDDEKSVDHGEAILKTVHGTRPAPTCGAHKPRVASLMSAHQSLQTPLEYFGGTSSHLELSAALDESAAVIKLMEEESHAAGKHIH